MIDYNRLYDYVIQPGISLPVDFADQRNKLWRKLLGIKKRTKTKTVIKKAILGSIGNFNYWEDNGEVKWPDNVHSYNWFEVVRGEKDINSMNLPGLRKHFVSIANSFIRKTNIETGIKKAEWWNLLSISYGGDPLKKREVLLWIMLSDMNIKTTLPPNLGCIDYNTIVALRYLKIVNGYEGNSFDYIEETKLRTECLKVVEEIIQKTRLGVSEVDAWLYYTGREIRHNYKDWEKYFCYRLGCYFY